MSSLNRPLSGDVLVFDLNALREELSRAPALASGGRQARTLLKDGGLRVTLIVLGANGAIPEHHADGPITVHVVDGRISFNIADETHELGPNEILSARAGLRHSVRSEPGGAFVLTVCLPDGTD